MSKVCKGCDEALPLSAFYKNPRASSGYYNFCKKCYRGSRRDRYRKAKERAVEYKGGACERCGGVFQPVVYDFHHKEPEDKLMTLNSNKVAFDWETRVKPELDKCMLLCANCHRMEHYGE